MNNIESVGAAERPFAVHIASSYAPLRSAWLQLEADGEFYPFQTFAWVSKLIDTVGVALAVTPILVLVSSRLGTPAMLAPLCLRRWGGLRVLEFMDCGLADYNAPLLHKEFVDGLTKDEFLELWHNVLASIGPPDVIHLNKIPERVGEAKNPFVMLGSHTHANSRQAPLNGSFSEFWRSRPAKLRQDNGRKRRRLSEQGKLEFRIARTAGEAEFFTGAMIRLKSRRYRTTGARDIFEHAAYRDFYLKLACEQVPHGIVHVSALMLDDTPIAAHWGLVSQGRLYHHMPAFDHDNWRKYSVGRLVLEDLIRWCCEQGVAVLDFTIGDETYKLEWAQQTTPLHVHLSGCSIAGRIYVAVRATRYKLLRVARGHPRLYALLEMIRAKTRKLRRQP